MPKVIATQSNIGGALYEGCVIPYRVHVPRHKIWLSSTAPRRAVTMPI